MLTDSDIKALTSDINVRNVIHMLVDDVKKADKVIAAQDDLIKTLELQVHDNQSLKEDYESLLRKHDEAMEAFKLMKEGAKRDEETIAHLQSLIKDPPRSETFKEVRDERDSALAKLAKVQELAVYAEGDTDSHIALVRAIREAIK